jgi:hypothetical protein
MHARVPRIKLEYIVGLLNKDASRLKIYEKPRHFTHIALASFAMMTIDCLMKRSYITLCCQQDGSNSSSSSDTSAITNQVSKTMQNNKILHGGEEEDYETCPFCRYFLDSPCSIQFKNWKECIDTSEKATDCMVEFYPLKVCMENHGIVMDHNDNHDHDQNLSS